jgi:hypothetical protein
VENNLLLKLWNKIFMTEETTKNKGNTILFMKPYKAQKWLAIAHPWFSP